MFQTRIVHFLYPLSHYSPAPWSHQRTPGALASSQYCPLRAQSLRYCYMTPQSRDHGFIASTILARATQSHSVVAFDVWKLTPRFHISFTEGICLVINAKSSLSAYLAHSVSLSIRDLLFLPECRKTKSVKARLPLYLQIAQNHSEIVQVKDMAFVNRLIIAAWVSSLSLTAVASMVDIARFAHSDSRMAPRDLTYRQTDDCPDDGDCVCTSWGADCDVSDWSWISCSTFPKACATSTATSTAPAKTPTPTVPATPTAGPIHCAPGNEDVYKSCWQDVHNSSVQDCGSVFYTQLPPGDTMTSSSPNVTQVYREGASGGQGGNGVTYSEFAIPIRGIQP